MLWLLLSGCTWIDADELAQRLAGDDTGGPDLEPADLDGDGFDSVASGGDDCWDNPEAIPVEFAAINGFVQPGAADVRPDATDTAYDGVDANCDGASDFDADADGYATANADYPQRDGSLGDDCYDTEADTYPGTGEVTTVYRPDEIHPDATDAWYDGTDANCDGASDYDQDQDGYDRDAECDDTNPLIYPNPGVEEVWYNGVDENCDGNRYDKDGDGHDSASYGGDDCWDDPDTLPPEFESRDEIQPTAAEVYPDAVERWYDGVDGDCAGDSDFDQDGDGVATDAWADRDGAYGLDCDDTDATVAPGAPDDFYDGIDGDCAGNSDYDADGDGFDSSAASVDGTDCDDADTAVNPDADEACGTAADDDCDGSLDRQDADGCLPWYADADRDTYGGTGTECWCDPQPTRGFDATNDDDCDDALAAVNPGGTEVCDAANTDEDCDSAADNGDTSASSAGKTTFYHDDDEDTYGDEDHAGSSYCDNPTTSAQAWVTDSSDCDDASSADNPGAAESVANGDDEDCDGTELCYVDADSDGYRNSDTSLTVSSLDFDCDDTGEGAATEPATDCDDTDSTAVVGSAEIVNDGIDQDCDGVDACYTDADGDNYGTTVVVDGSSLSCATGSGAAVSTDCDDASSSDYPGAAETVANSDDEDCDGVDSCYTDADGDNYGTTVVVDGSTLDCTTGTGAPVSTDCDDASSSDYPGATETTANSDDEDCDGVDSCYTDADGDNYGTTVVVDGSSLSCTTGTGAPVSTDCNDASASVYPAATETVADSTDQDCDGVDSCYTDADGDNYGTTVVVDGSSLSCTTGTGAPVSTDCNDASATVYPGATETVADSVDQDCDTVDTCYTDADGDNYGTTVTVDGSTLNCTTGTGAALSTDCDDASSSDYPGATETTGNGDDESCDGTETCYDDDDNDGYLDTTADTRTSADTDCADAYEGTNTDLTTDCDDSDAGDYPSASETVGNGDDEDCDGTETCYDDDDNDGYLDTTADTRSSTDTDCTDAYEGPSTDLTTDCDDTDAYSYPGATEYCDGQQNNCSTAWTTASEDGVISYTTTAGVWSNLASSSSLSLASTGTYYFCAGTYSTKLVGSSDTVSVVGYYGAASTILDNASTGSTVSVTSGSVTLDGFTITGGTGTTGYGGGVLASGTRGATPTITLQDCIVELNDATYGGGVAAASTAWVSLLGTTVQDNIATTNGGGIWVATGALIDISDGSAVAYNEAGRGGGLYLEGSGDATLDDSSVEANSASGASGLGGGVYVNTGTFAMTNGATVHSNTASDGGGLLIYTGSASCATGTGIYANTATNNGGGIYLDDTAGSFTATDCDFSGTGDNSPDDVYAVYGSYASYGSTATFACTLGLCSPTTDP
ncbi:MAG: right-handed parallel beta-helix repeat-containing protein [Pseudomonadota bacterium]|nr:right-handed parallel beta-helix repeat-containing protein [Pseudomonadota bacterium]